VSQDTRRRKCQLDFAIVRLQCASEETSWPCTNTVNVAAPLSPFYSTTRCKKMPHMETAIVFIFECEDPEMGHSHIRYLSHLLVPTYRTATTKIGKTSSSVGLFPLESLGPCIWDILSYRRRAQHTDVIRDRQIQTLSLSQWKL